MLLSEMVRRVGNEQNLVSDTTFSGGNTVHDWTTRKSFTVSLATARNVLVVFSLKMRNTEPYSYAVKAGGRCLIDGTPIFGSGMMNVSVPSSSTVYYTFCAITVLSSGSHTFDFQTSIAYTASASVSIEIGDIYIGFVDFADSIFTSSYASLDIPSGSTMNVINRSISIPPARRTCVGSIKKFNVNVLALMWVDDAAISFVKNPGESASAGVNWQIFLNDVQVAWTERRDDYQTNNPAYCEGAYGLYSFQADPGTTQNIKINCYNISGSNRTVKASIIIIVSPWIMGYTEGEILGLSFPQGSTLYLVLEPLWLNAAKTVKLGKRRARTFGDATDYYSIASGADILVWSYTFESIEVSNCILVVDGWGGCISVIAVDVR